MASDATSSSRSVGTSPPTVSTCIDESSPELQFILKFKSLPELWDKRNEDYSNRYKRLDAQKKLLPILRQRNVQATIIDVRKKINTIRTNYRRERKKLIRAKRSSKLGSDDYQPRGRFFEQLSFLVSNDEDLKSENSDVQYLDETTEYDDEWAPKIGQSMSSIIVQDEPKSESKFREQYIKEYEIYDPISTSTEPTRISTTALYWTEKLDRLNHTQRIYAERAINEILLEAELGNLHKYSVSINESK